MTREERSQIVNSAITKIQDSIQALTAAQAEVVRLQALIDADPNAAEVKRLEALLVTAEAARDAAISDLEAVDGDLIRLKEAVGS